MVLSVVVVVPWFMVPLPVVVVSVVVPVVVVRGELQYVNTVARANKQRTFFMYVVLSSNK
jgi:hypothetical protein